MYTLIDLIQNGNMNAYMEALHYVSQLNEPKELMIIPNANQVDLCDQLDIIPLDKVEKFFQENLNLESMAKAIGELTESN